jgi:hypothetical protein
MVRNLFADLPAPGTEETFEQLAGGAAVRIERIVSFGQRSAEGFWFDQADDEWVVVLEGSAGLRFEGRERRHRSSARRLARDPGPCAPPRRVDRRPNDLARGPLPLTTGLVVVLRRCELAGRCFTPLMKNDIRYDGVPVT